MKRGLRFPRTLARLLAYRLLRIAFRKRYYPFVVVLVLWK